MAGYLVGFALNLGNANIDSLEVARTYCTAFKTRMSLTHIAGRVMASNTCMQMITTLVWQAVRGKVSMACT